MILPNLIAVTVDYNEGRIAITADETIDVTPTTKVNLTNLYLGNVLYTRDVHLPGASVLVGNDGYTFHIRMTETQRANVLRISSVPGGDGDVVVLQGDPGAVRDVAGNLNPFVTNGLSATEIADTSKPFAESAEIF